LGSGMFIPDPDFYPSRIPATKERGEQEFVVIPFYVATNLTKLKIIFGFEKLRKKIWVNFRRIM
jgi:hypothetical protein